MYESALQHAFADYRINHDGAEQVVVLSQVGGNLHAFCNASRQINGGNHGIGVADIESVFFQPVLQCMGNLPPFVATDEEICMNLRYNMRSQTFAKSLTMPMVEGAIKRLELLKTQPERREKLWQIAHALQNGLKEDGLNIGNTNSMVFRHRWGPWFRSRGRRQPTDGS